MGAQRTEAGKAESPVYICPPRPYARIYVHMDEEDGSGRFPRWNSGGTQNKRVVVGLWAIDEAVSALLSRAVVISQHGHLANWALVLGSP